MEDRWAPPDPTHRITHATDHATIARIRRAVRLRAHERLATHRGRHDTRIVVLLVVVVTTFTYAVSDSSQDPTLDTLRQDLVPTVVAR